MVSKKVYGIYCLYLRTREYTLKKRAHLGFFLITRVAISRPKCLHFLSVMSAPSRNLCVSKVVYVGSLCQFRGIFRRNPARSVELNFRTQKRWKRRIGISFALFTPFVPQRNSVKHFDHVCTLSRFENDCTPGRVDILCEHTQHPNASTRAF